MQKHEKLTQEQRLILALVKITMDPTRGTLKQITIESAAEADRIFSMLMGEEVPPRR